MNVPLLVRRFTPGSMLVPYTVSLHCTTGFDVSDFKISAVTATLAASHVCIIGKCSKLQSASDKTHLNSFLVIPGNGNVQGGV